jgi:hypothetical protein
MFRGSVKGIGYPLHSTVSPFTYTSVGHRVPSHFNWSLYEYRCTQHYIQIPIPSARVLLIISCFEFLWSVQIKNYSNDYFYGARVEVNMVRSSGVPRDFVVCFNKFSWGQRTEKGDLGAVAPLVRVSGSSCNLVQGISIHIVNFS